MSQRIIGFLVKFLDLVLDGIGSTLVRFAGLVG